jgi:hypothetical protein
MSTVPFWYQFASALPRYAARAIAMRIGVLFRRLFYRGLFAISDLGAQL